MGKSATLARTETGRPGLEPAPDVAELRSRIAEIIMAEFGSCGIWEQAAKRAAGRIVAAIEGVTASRLQD